MTRREAVLAATILVAGGCASAGTDPVPPEAASRAVDALSRAQAEAYRPRRLKALYRGEVAPTVGAIGRGFLALWWDGSTLVWRTTAPLAGDGQRGTISLVDASGAPLPIPGRLDPAEAIGALLGAPGGKVAGTPTGRGERVTLTLDTGTSVTLDGSGRVVGTRYSGGVEVTYGPGAGLPRKISAVSREGRAVLDLESLGPWPEGETPP